MRRVDRRTNALSDGPTDTASYRGALSHLKKEAEEKEGGRKCNANRGAKKKKNRQNQREQKKKQKEN